MKTSFILEYPWWFVLLCVALGIIVAWLLYGNKTYIFRENESKWWKRGLFALRFLSTFLVAFLLLSPLIKTKRTQEEKPVILLLQDNTSSLKTSFGKFSAETYKQDLNSLIEEVGKEYEVIPYNFGDHLQDFGAPIFDQQETDIASALEEAFVRYDNRNIGAVIIATDGIYNKGNSPLYNRSIAQMPVYTIALGDTAIQKDAFIRHLQYPDIVYLGDRFNIQVEIEANHLQGQNTVLEITSAEGRSLLSQTIAVNADHFIYKTEVVADVLKPGVQSYKVQLKPMAGEKIAVNNYDAAYIDVIDGRQKILLLYDAPHPDVKAIKSAIETNKNYEVETEDVKTFTKNYNNYDLIIFDGIPSANSSAKLSWMQDVAKSGKSVLYILSANTSLALFNSLQQHLQITGSSQTGNEVTPVYKSSFSKFTLSESAVQTLTQLPPLLAPHGKYQLATNADVLFKQQLGKISTEVPLFAAFEVNATKTGVLAGEGLWRWRLNEFLQNKNYNATDELINKMVQYLTVKGDKRRFRVHLPKNIFNANEPVLLDAELYNESYELVNEVDASISIRSDQGKTYDFTFDKTVNAYTLNAGILPVGNYSSNAKTTYKGQSYAATANFSIRPVNVEQLNVQANHGLLRTLATQSGGKFYYPQEMENIAKDMKENNKIRSVLYDTINTKPLIDWKIIFVFVLLLLAAEWFIRKYNGLI